MDPDEDPVGSPPRRPRGPQAPRRTRGGDGAGGASSSHRGGPASADERNRAALPNSSRRAASSARRRRDSSAMSGSGRSVSGSAAASARGDARASSGGAGGHHHHRPSRHSEGKSVHGGHSRRRDSSSRAGGSERGSRQADRSDRSARERRTGGGHRHHSSSSARPSSRPGGSRRDGRVREERKPSRDGGDGGGGGRGRPDSDESSEEFIDFTSDIDEDDDGDGPDDLTETPSAAHFDDEAGEAAAGGSIGFEERIGDQDSRGGGRVRRRSVDGGERFEPIGEDDADDGDSEDSFGEDGGAMVLTNSPEPNPRRSADADAGAFPLLAAAPHAHREVDSASIADMTFTEVLSKFDPPTSDGGDGGGNRPSTPADLEPDLDAKSHLSRFNAPPSPSGPEPNRRRRTPGEDGGATADARTAARGQDPPEGRRGGDPSQAGSADPPPYRGGSPTTRRPSRRDGPPPPQDGPRRPEIKGILKKRGAPIPITQFGRPVLQFHEDDGGDGGGDGASDSDGGTGMDESDPDMTEEKSSRSAPPALATGGDRDDDRSAYSSATQTTLGTARSGLRSGKWAAANERALAAQAGHVDDDEGDDEDGTEYDYEDPEYDALSAASDEHTLKSAADARFDRSRSHFLRTADLGLTQDTIYAEQFLEDERTKPEPHYHHPSPHPPPGVQFNIDENWVSVDDGRGGHSPIAPQAVDALVAMGYRAASDPMMWTPTSKTRKYMTEKELRFDDIPIPGSVDEGVGGPDDGDCLVWSGKFPHKYHGHDQPVVRSQAIVNMTAEELVDLLMDSGRVGEYNKSSIGRDDELVLSDGTDLDSCPFSGQRKKKLTGVVMAGATIVDGNAVMDSESDCDESVEVEEIVEEIEHDNGDRSVRTVQTSASRRRRSSFVGVTKLVRTQNKPPLIRRVLEFYTLLHCRALTDEQGDGYIIVGRGITPASEDERGGKGVMRSEILINVHIIRKLHKHRRGGGGGGSSSGGSSSRDRKRGSRYKTVSDSGRRAGKGDLSNRCLLITVNHIKSAMIPKMIAKRVGLSAAVNFVLDIRALSTYPG